MRKSQANYIQGVSSRHKTSGKRRANPIQELGELIHLQNKSMQTGE